MERRKVAQEEAMKEFLNNSAVAINAEEGMVQEASYPGKDSLERMLDERDRRLERRIKAIVEETFSSILNKRLSKLEDMLCKSNGNFESM
jgi:hypothetical protein